jgi:hypothetical protein
MSSIVKFSKAGLPAVTSLTSALRQMENEVAAVGTAILKMDKTGHWVFGADQTEVEDDSLWAVNPFSFVHGYIAWGDGEVLGESMVSVSEPLPEPPAAPPQARKGWEKQVGLSLKCISGEDTGLEVRYTTTSVGGKRGVQTLAVAIAEQVDKDQAKPVAIVRLGKEHYQHKSYGRIFTPVFEVVRWIGMEGDAPESVEAEAPAVTEAAATTGRRRRAG